MWRLSSYKPFPRQSFTDSGHLFGPTLPLCLLLTHHSSLNFFQVLILILCGYFWIDDGFLTIKAEIFFINFFVFTPFSTFFSGDFLENDPTNGIASVALLRNSRLLATACFEKWLENEKYKTSPQRLFCQFYPLMRD